VRAKTPNSGRSWNALRMAGVITVSGWFLGLLTLRGRPISAAVFAFYLAYSLKYLFVLNVA
jgi:uncharacterized membrane protein YccC